MTEPTKRAGDAEIDHDGLRAAYAYWLRKCAGRPMPSRADIDPAEIPQLLPHVILIDVEPAGFRFRLVGSHIYDARGRQGVRELTGRYLDEVKYDMASSTALVDLARSVVASRRPVLCLAPAAPVPEGEGSQRFIAMPLSTDGVAVDMLLIAIYVSREVIPGLNGLKLTQL